MESALYERTVYCVSFKDAYKSYTNRRTDIDITDTHSHIDTTQHTQQGAGQQKSNDSHPRTPHPPVRVTHQANSDQPITAARSSEITQTASSIQPTQDTSNTDHIPMVIILIKILIELCNTLSHTHKINTTSAIDTLTNLQQYLPMESHGK